MKYALAAVLAAALALLAWRALRPAPGSLASYEPLPPITAQKTGAAPAAAPVAVPSAPPPNAAAPAGAQALPAAKAAVPAAQPPAPAQNAEAAAAAKLAVLQEILKAKDDNDPRLDSDFNDLSPQARRLFRREYARLPAEGRNERGTIVYLLGKNLKTAEDWEFLRGVVTEPACLSLADCSRPAAAAPESHFDSGMELTLSYPAVVALKRAERVLWTSQETGRRDEAAAQARQLVLAARNSPAKLVAGMAEDLEKRFPAGPR